MRYVFVELRSDSGHGDTAKAAAEADPGVSTDARDAVLAAHLAICKLRAGT